MYRVLVLDDDEFVRQFIINTLRTSGFILLDAGSCIHPSSNTDCALECQCDIGTPDLIIAAVISTRGCSGVETAQKALSKWPKVKVLLTSATPPSCWPEHISKLMHSLSNKCGWLFLPKPYSSQTFVSAVRGLLEGC